MQSPVLVSTRWYWYIFSPDRSTSTIQCGHKSATLRYLTVRYLADFIPQDEGAIRCEKKLGGLITEYYREAA